MWAVPFSQAGSDMLYRLSVAHMARRVKATSGTDTRLTLVQQRQRLAAAMASFHKAGQKHMPGFMPGDGGLLESDPTAFGAEWDLDLTGGIGDGQGDISADQPETHAIGLPSTFGMEFLVQMDKSALARKERLLREGQLNDALQGIRTGIGYKSLLYRAKVRNASSYRAKLRSFDDVHVADEGVRKHVRQYQQARRAMERLFDVDDEEDARELARFQAKYKDIQKEDLRVSTAVIESFTPGLRNEHSAWFWNISDNEMGEETQWIQDCKTKRFAPGVLRCSSNYFRSPNALAEGVRPQGTLGRGASPCSIRNAMHSEVVRMEGCRVGEVVTAWGYGRARRIRASAGRNVAESARPCSRSVCDGTEREHTVDVSCAGVARSVLKAPNVHVT